jgi:EpsI family protein
MPLRLFVLACSFLAAAAGAARLDHPAPPPQREPLAGLPAQLGPWIGEPAPPIATDVVNTLGVDDYVNRIYAAGTGDDAPIAVYVGYYASQRQGDTIHSPLNCLPGAGWQPVTRERATLTLPGVGSIVVNQLVIEKGLDREAVMYWYQSHGRVIASEYWSKAYLIWDAVRSNRSDAALVRVISPIRGDDRSADAATGRLTQFVAALFPHLERFLPA